MNLYYSEYSLHYDNTLMSVLCQNKRSTCRNFAIHALLGQVINKLTTYIN